MTKKSKLIAMHLCNKKQSLIFDPLPGEIISLWRKLFPGALCSLAILPLTQLNSQRKQIEKQWLHKKERLTLHNFTFPKRNREWLGGRICSKQSLHTFLHEQPLPLPGHTQYRIASETSGKPYFTAEKDSTILFPELSISHSKGFAAAVVSETDCGIDIQYPTESLLRVKEQYSNKTEENLLRKSLPQLSSLQRLTLLWTGKEAVKKMLSPFGMPGFHEIALRSLSPHSQPCTGLQFSIGEKTNIQVATSIIDNGFGLALCCAPPTPPTTPTTRHA